MKFALILFASLLTTVAAAEFKTATFYKAVCPSTENVYCHYRTSWDAGSWLTRKNAQEDADRHNENCKGHAAYVIETQ